jgi:hypothetical protein
LVLKRDVPEYEADATRIVIAGMRFLALLAVLLLLDGCTGQLLVSGLLLAAKTPEVFIHIDEEAITA